MSDVSAELPSTREVPGSVSTRQTVQISKLRAGSRFSYEMCKFRVQYESDWWELASEFLFLERQKARLHSLFEESRGLVESENWLALSVCLSSLEPVEVGGVQWSPSDTLFFRRVVSDQERRTADTLSCRSGRPISPEDILSAGKSVAGRVVLTVISARLKELLRRSEGLRRQLDRIAIESRTGLTCHRCGGMGNVPINPRYERSERQITYLDKPEECTLCRGSGRLGVPVLFVPRESSTADDVDRKIEGIDPSVFLGMHLE
jgi:hypothetical protein